MALLTKVNRRVNNRVRQVSDESLYGRQEVWIPAGAGRGAAGDCEDIVLEKRKELLDLGYPARELTMAVVYSHTIGLHTVLVATMSDGDYVLDSRTPHLDRWDRTPYVWIERQEPGKLLVWRTIDKRGSTQRPT